MNHVFSPPVIIFFSIYYNASLAIYTFTNTERFFYSSFNEYQYAQKFQLSFQVSVLALLAILYNVQALVILPPARLHTTVHIQNNNQNFPSFR